jgi:hypothetical protein
MEPIKSFIYYKPIENVKKTLETTLVKDKITKEQEEIVPPEKDAKLEDKDNIPKTPQNKPKVQNEQPAALTKVIVPPLKDEQKQTITKYKSMQSLSLLKDRINKEIIDQEMYNSSKPNTGSVMFGKPNYVPHSFVEDSEKKLIDSTETQVGNGFSVTKNDNGTCTLTEDLSVIGLQGKTTSSFGCGLSKEEKNFKNHMKKVLKKLGK